VLHLPFDDFRSIRFLSTERIHCLRRPSLGNANANRVELPGCDDSRLSLAFEHAFSLHDAVAGPVEYCVRITGSISVQVAFCIAVAAAVTIDDCISNSDRFSGVRRRDTDFCLISGTPLLVMHFIAGSERRGVSIHDNDAGGVRDCDAGSNPFAVSSGNSIAKPGASLPHVRRPKYCGVHLFLC
jgi:hypothetical protein